MADDTGRVAGEAWAEWTEEVRLAMGWNGGVSLAIWMGGVAVEVDQARRARPPMPVDEGTTDPPKVAGPATNTTDLYYALLSAFDRLLVVDILAGASAGGLNGALLAGAMMHDKQLEADFLRDKWITIGDFGTLLQPLSNKGPASIMQGQRYYEQLRATFIDLLKSKGPPTGFGCGGRYPVMLDVQVTDVLGKQYCFNDDWDQPFYASEYRAPARFRRADDYTAGTLAAAARASSSFPAAFEPQMLNGKAAALIGFPGKTRWAIDGGLLENAPIKPAIELIPRVPTALPVKRYVCYVNAAPTGLEEDDDTPTGQPTLAKVLGYTINLPRDGRVIDQLYALDDASRRAGATADAGVRLLALDRDVLRATANGLLTTYQNRRALLSLTELLGNVLDDGLPSGGPGRARHALERLASLPPVEGEPPSPPAARLPWIPASVDPPGSPEEWRWGIRVAQRVLQLQLDALRAALRAMTINDDITRVITALHEIGSELHALDALYDDFADPLGASVQAVQRLLCDKQEDRQRALDDLTNLARGIGATVYSYLRPATSSFVEAYHTLSAPTLERAGLPAAADLFGTDGLVDRSREADPLAGYLRRALAIETIRRSFSDDFDIDSAQPLHVAQLTPLVPSPLFDPDPLGDNRGRRINAKGEAVYAGPFTAKDKLAGLRLSHFAGFYRASWRENDFMWGRFDGAAAITRLLVDSRRTQALAKLDSRDRELAPWNQLAAALVPAAENDERLRLIVELLEHVPDGEPLPADRTPDTIRPILAEAMRRDLLDGDGRLTAAACTRALQYEILREEVQHLLEQVRADKEAGAYRATLDWHPDNGLWEIIQELRGGDEEQPFDSLPVRLGCDDADEATSTLALRTLSQTMLVALAALAGALPLTKSLQPVRLPLLAVAGATARRLLDRLAVAAGFAGAAWYLSGRWLTIPAPIPQSAIHTAAERTAAKKAAEIPLHAVWSPQVIVLWLAIFSVIGVVAVPGLRAVRTHSTPRRIWEAAVALVFLVCGGAVALGWQWDLHGTITALTSWGSNFSPPDNLLWAAAAAAGVHAASSLDTVLRFAGPVVNRLGKWVSLSSLTLGGIGGALAYYAAKDALYPALRDGGFNTVCAILALAGPVAVASYVSVGPALWKNLKALWANLNRLASFIKKTRPATAPKASSAKRRPQRTIRWPWRHR